MPQMAPTWWSMIFITSLLTFIVFITKTYFNKTIKMKYSTKTNKTPNINWKW